MNQSKTITRRNMLKGSLAAAGGLALAPLVTACGGQTEGESGAASLGRNASATISYMYAEYSSAGAALPDLIRGFREKFPNIKVKIRSFATYDDVLQAVQAAGAARDLPALAQVGYESVAYAAGTLPHLPISEAAERDPQVSGWLDGFPKNILRLGQADGTQVGMPLTMGSPFLVYNEDLLEQAGIGAAPRTWPEVREAALGIKEETGKVGVLMPDSDFWTAQGLVESNGARVLIEENGGARTGVGSPESVEAIDFWAAMINEDESSVLTDWVQGPTSFAKGNAGMIVSSSGLITSAPENGGVRMGTAPFPTWGDKPRRVPVGGNATFIFAQEEDQQLAAWEFVKYVNSPEGLGFWTTATGYLPTRSELAEGSGPIAAYYEDNPLLKSELDQLPDYVPWVSWPGSEGPEAEQALIDARDRVLTGDTDAATAMPEAAERVNEMIGS